jgi:DNA-binding MarR family transcriptional regulator
MNGQPISPASLERLTAALVGVTARALAHAGQAGDLSLWQWRTLVVVGGSDGVRVGDVAGRVGISMPSASRLVKRLEQRGLVETARDPLDRRATIVRSSQSGTSVLASVLRRRQELVAEALAETSPLPETTDQVIGAVAAALSRYT